MSIPFDSSRFFCGLFGAGSHGPALHVEEIRRTHAEAFGLGRRDRRGPVRPQAATGPAAGSRSAPSDHDGGEVSKS